MADQLLLEQVAENLALVRERLKTAAERTGRDPGEIRLVAVSKTFGIEHVRAAYLAGQRLFGENRVQEAEGKIQAWRERWPADPEPEWHLIGHLQTNKARQAAGLFKLVHSVDSARLARELDRHAPQAGRTLDVLLEVNVSGEESKFGLSPAALDAAVAEIRPLDRIAVRGLMTVAPLGASGEAARPYFRQLRELRDHLREGDSGVGWTELSMGMTNDFEAAISEGATLVRIGRAIFGERD